MPDIAALIRKLGYELTGTTPEELAAIIKSESATCAKVIKDAAIGAD
jgi:tripartite-type tricarboxylate transporter receptor subunit TctC